MLQAMRENASSWIIKILLLAIVIAFVFMGLGSYQAQRSNKIGMINEQPISIDEYRETYNNLLQRVRQQFGSNLNDEMLKMLNLKSQAMDQIITRVLILQEAEKLNLMVSDQELTKMIQDMQVFKQNASFNVGVYERLLKRAGISPEQFEKDQRDQMLAQKLQQVIAGSIHVSEAEARQWYDWENALVNIKAAQFDPETYTDIEPTTEEIKAYFDKNKNNYQTQPKVKVRYVHFSPAGYEKDVQVTMEEIQEYYDNNPETFSKPKTVEARHILIKPDTVNTDEEVLVRIQQLEIRLRGGEDFATLARSNSQDTLSAAKGGSLGWLNKGDTVPEFEEALEDLEPGEISKPVKTMFGWHLVQVQERRTHDSTEDYERSKVKSLIRSRKYDEELFLWLRRLRDESYVEYKIDDL